MPIQETLKRLDELEAKATKGRWFARFAFKKDKNLEGLTLVGATAPGHAIVTSHEGGTSPSNDLELIVELRNAYPSLRAEIARFQEENDLMRGIVKVSWAWKKPLSAKEMKFITDIQI